MAEFRESILFESSLEKRAPTRIWGMKLGKAQPLSSLYRKEGE